MRAVPTVLVLALSAACGGDEQSSSAGPELADFAGTWQNTAMLEGVSDPVPSTTTVSSDGSTWTMSLEGRPDIPLEASIVGDSVIVQSAEYESVLRAGVMVSVRFAMVLHDGMLMGDLVATYRAPDGTETVTGTIQGTRMQE